jgi:metal-sulfur cluster biosynthetic enzyme
MTKEQIRETLKQVLDPEIGINIVDMGLVYTVEIKARRTLHSTNHDLPSLPFAWRDH